MREIQSQVVLPMDAIATFCRRWNIAQFALFGSVLGEDFGPDSDIDVLVTFASGAERSPDREAMRAEIEAIFGRPVDLTYRRVIEHDPNYIIRKAILQSARVIYAA
jgi:predicted nucleotidyltransferase